MIIKEEYKGKYILATTRKAIYTDIAYAKITIWKSKQASDIGCCLGAVTIKNVCLGSNPDKYHSYILEVVDKVLEETSAI